MRIFKIWNSKFHIENQKFQSWKFRNLKLEIFKPNSCYAVRLQCIRLSVCLWSVCLSVFSCFWAYEFGHQTSSTVVSSHSKLKQHPAYEFGHQTSSTVVSSHSKLKQHPTNVAKQGYNENFRLWSPIKQMKHLLIV